MTQTKRLVMLSVMGLMTACAPVVSERPCPRVTEFPPAVQAAAADEVEGQPNITRMMDAMASDRAFNREICR